MASTITFSGQSDWVGHNPIFWTLIRYLREHIGDSQNVTEQLDVPITTTIQFCDFSGFTREDMEDVKRATCQLKADFANVWTYKEPAEEWVGHLDDILELIDKRIEELS